MTRYWIFKSEPYEFSISNLAECLTTRWDGIRNYQARNFIREMNVDDVVYFYHSNCKVPGIYGKMTVITPSYTDPTANEKDSKYFDKKAANLNSWLSVDVMYKDKYKEPLTLHSIKQLALGDSPLTTKGNRLSIIPLTDEQYELIEREINTLNDL